MPNEHFEKIFVEISRFLKSSGLEDVFVDKIKYTSPMQLVVDSYVLLKEVNLMPNLVKKGGKSDKLSAKYRVEGNNAFKRKEDMIALKNYTKAVAVAYSGGEELALAYANRSAVTFSLGEYRHSINDITRALCGNYPEKLKYKLYERKGRCLLELNKKKEAGDLFLSAITFLTKSELDSHKVNEIKNNLEMLMKKANLVDLQVSCDMEQDCHLPQLSHPPSDYIQVASSAIDICFSNIMGRHVVATTDLKPGDVLAVEKPYASVLLPDMYTFYCFMCKKRCHSLLPCLHCTEVLFCSEKCRNESWEQSHCIECNLLPTLLKFGCENMELLAVKILLLASGAGKLLIQLLQSEKELELHDNPREKGFIGGKYLSDLYKSTHNLEMNDQIREISDTLRRSFMAALILYALEECTDFFLYYEKQCRDSPMFLYYLNEIPDGDGLTIAKSFVGALILRYLFSVPCNAHEVSEMRLKPKDNEFETESVEIGGAIYPFLSLINHSCDPNVVRHNYNGDVIALIAIQVIKQGEQIFDNYSYHHAVHTKEERQSHLLSQYYFVCKCQACLYDWPLYANMPEKNASYRENVNKQEIEKSSVKFKTSLKEINSGKTEGQLPFLYDHLTLLHRTTLRPWKEYNQCQEAIKQCLSVQANHYSYKSYYED